MAQETALGCTPVGDGNTARSPDSGAAPGTSTAQVDNEVPNIPHDSTGQPENIPGTPSGSGRFHDLGYGATAFGNLGPLISSMLYNTLTYLAKPPSMKTPVLQGSDILTYKTFKHSVKLWEKQCNLPLSERAIRLAGESFPPGSKAASIVANIDPDSLDTDQGIEVLFKVLDKHLLPSVPFQILRATHDVYRYVRPKGVSVQDAADEYDRRYKELLKFNADQEEVQALLMLNAMDLPAQVNQNLVTAAGRPLTYENMLDTLRFHSSLDQVCGTQQPAGESPLMGEDSQKSGGGPAGTLYTENRGYRDASRGWYRGRYNNRRGQPYGYKKGPERKDSQVTGKNNLGRTGNLKRCYISNSPDHLMLACPKRVPGKVSGALLSGLTTCNN